jgi:hypothetical protein
VDVIIVTSACLRAEDFIGNDCEEAVEVVSTHCAIKESAKLRGEPVFNNGFQGNTAVSIHTISLSHGMR